MSRIIVSRVVPFAAVVTALSLSGCTVVPPQGPSFAAAPGAGKTAEAFQNDDSQCRYYAAQANGYVTPAQGATQSGVGTAAIGTVAGAALGALLGAAAGNAGAGAAIGAGTGLVGGAAVGAGNARVSGSSLQRNYDVNYARCMVARGNRVPQAPQPVIIQQPPVVVQRPPVVVYPPPAYAYPPPAYYPPAY